MPDRLPKDFIRIFWSGMGVCASVLMFVFAFNNLIVWVFWIALIGLALFFIIQKRGTIPFFVGLISGMIFLAAIFFYLASIGMWLPKPTLY